MLDIGQRLPIIRDRMTVESLIENRYQIVNRLPSVSARHERILLKKVAGAGHVIISFSGTSLPRTKEALSNQRALVEQLLQPPVALLCRVVESRIESDFQMTVSEYPGELTLMSVVRERGALRLDEVEAFLRVVLEACEAATARGWPRLDLRAEALCLDPRLGLPRIPAPDVPLYDGDEAEAIPMDSKEYVLPFAQLCRDLLDLSKDFDAPSQINAHQRALLKQVLQGDGANRFSSARAFVDVVFDGSRDTSMSLHTERLKNFTATVTHSDLHSGLSSAMLTIKMPPPVASPQVNPVDIIRVKSADRQALAEMKPTRRLRLLPHTEDAPVLSVVADQWLSLGRSVGGADFIAQFRPRTNVNDARSRKISRTQARILKLGTKLVVDEQGPVNPTLVGDSPVGPHQELPFPVEMLLAGEYPAEAYHVPSEYRRQREIENPPVFDSVGLDGGVLVRPNSSGVFLNEAVMLFSDIGIHFSHSGRPWFRADANTLPIARIHRYADQFWLEPIDVTNVTSRGGNTTPHELILLHNGVKLTIGAFSYTVQSYSVGEGLTTRGAFTSRRN